jgi:hypothetical protein
MYTLEIDRDIEEDEYEQDFDVTSLKGSVKSQRSKKMIYEQRKKISKEPTADLSNQNEPSSFPNTTRELINGNRSVVKNPNLDKKVDEKNLTEQKQEEVRDPYAIMHKDSQFWTCCNKR